MVACSATLAGAARCRGTKEVGVFLCAHQFVGQNKNSVLTWSCSSRVGIMRAASREEREKSEMEAAGPSSGMAGVDREVFMPGPMAT